MSDYTIENLIELRKRVVTEVNQDKLSVMTGARLLGMTRQGLWKLRRSVERNGLETAIIGIKRGPKRYHRVWNRTPAWIEDKVEELWTAHGVGHDRLVWLLDDFTIDISRSTVYRILVRRRLLIPKEKTKREKPRLYTKGYPGEEVQIDTTLPFGRGRDKGVMISAIDDYSRWGMAEIYLGNTALNAALFLKRFVSLAPFPVTAVRVDNGSEFKKEFIRECHHYDITLMRNPANSPQMVRSRDFIAPLKKSVFGESKHNQRISNMLVIGSLVIWHGIIPFVDTVVMG